MSVEDPFFVVKGEVEKAIKKCHELEHRWREMLDEESPVKRDDYDRVSNELRNSLRSIEWDLEDLDETISIVESNPHKFQISNDDLQNRRNFINDTRHCIQGMKDELNNPKNKAKADKVLRKSLMSNGLRTTHKSTNNSHSKLHMESENDNNAFLDDQQQQQRLIMEQQDDQLDLVADSVGILKNMSKSIGNELDDQAIMLDDLGTEMENTQHRMDSVLKKMAKVTHLSNDRRQWCAIGFLGSSIFVLFLILVV